MKAKVGDDDSEMNGFKKLKCLDVFAGCGGLFLAHTMTYSIYNIRCIYNII